MQDILESDWTLAAVKRREEERLRSERAAREGDAPTIQASHAPDMSGDHWIAAAFRRRQAEERAKAASHPPSGDRADAAGREVPVDNWLIEGFKRHREEERRLEIIAQSEEAVADAAGDDHSTSASMRALVVVDEIGKPTQAGTAGREAGADGQASSGDFGALVARRGGTALVTRPKGAARLIAIAGVIVVGLVSVFGLKTALWNLGESPRGFDQGPPNAAPPPKTSVAPPPKQTRAPADGGDPPAHPADAAPAKPSDAAPAPPKPQTSTPNPAAPIPQPQPQAPSPSAQQGDKPAQDNRAAPAAPVPAGPKDAASPATSDKDSTAKPASVGSEKSRDGGGAEQDQNASEPQRPTPNANSDSKPKQQAKGKNGARHPSGKSDGFSALLKRTANSVRRFFGRLGVRQ